MSNSVPPYILRAMVEDDKAFIFTTWIKHYWKAPYMNACPPGIYLPNQRTVITNLLERANVLVACTPEDPSGIMAYMVYEFVQLGEGLGDILILHWLHRKDIFRDSGLGLDILHRIYPTAKVDPIIVTHNFKKFGDFRTQYHLSLDPYFVHNTKE